MTNRDPSKRPTLEQARQSINSQFLGLSTFPKRWPITPPGTPFRNQCIYILAGVTTEIVISVRRVLRLIYVRA
jgi:hypothetical protein